MATRAVRLLSAWAFEVGVGRLVEKKDGGMTAAKAVQVHPGPLVGNQVSILDGLTAGQQIVASGANLLRSGDVVREIQ